MPTFIVILLVFLIYKPLFEVLGMEALKYLPLGALSLGILKYSLKPKGVLFIGRLVTRQTFLIYLTLSVIFIVSIFKALDSKMTAKSAVNYALQLLLMIIFLYAFISRLHHDTPDFKEFSRKILLALIGSFSVFIWINVILYFGGISASTLEGVYPEPSVMAQSLGLPIRRDGFAFAGHPNTFAVFLGAVLTFNALAFLIGGYPKYQRLFFLANCVMCCFCALVVDSRATVGSSFLAVGGIWALMQLRQIDRTKLIVIAIPIVSLFTITLLQEFSKSEFASSISRNSSEFATGNNRDIIWGFCLEEMQDFKPEHLFGFGQSGHIHSGVQMRWRRILTGYDTYTHSFVFQSFLDIGYVGLILIVYLLYIVTQYSLKLYHLGNPHMLILIAFPIYYLLSGIFEGTFGIFNYTYTQFFFLCTLTGILLYNQYLKSENSRKKNPAQTRISTVKPFTISSHIS